MRKITNSHDVLILSGGLGTRLRPMISDLPKSLAPVNDKSFLDLLIANLSNQGFKRFILLIGYLGERIIEHFSSVDQLDIVFSVEKKILGTAGAVKNAEPLINSDPFLVLNGDSLCDINYNGLIDFHKSKQSSLTIAISKSREAQDYGQIEIGKDNRIVSFSEKKSINKVSYVNAGVYVLNKTVLKYIPLNEKYSNEFDFFPYVIRNSNCFGYEVKNDFWDIGTPSKYIDFISAFKR